MKQVLEPSQNPAEQVDYIGQMFKQYGFAECASADDFELPPEAPKITQPYFLMDDFKGKEQFGPARFFKAQVRNHQEFIVVYPSQTQNGRFGYSRYHYDSNDWGGNDSGSVYGNFENVLKDLTKKQTYMEEQEAGRIFRIYKEREGRIYEMALAAGFQPCESFADFGLSPEMATAAINSSQSPLRGDSTALIAVLDARARASVAAGVNDKLLPVQYFKMTKKDGSEAYLMARGSGRYIQAVGYPYYRGRKEWSGNHDFDGYEFEKFLKDIAWVKEEEE